MLDDGSEISQEEISRLRGRVDELVARESWPEIWSMAKEGPTLVTVPAMKCLARANWTPPVKDKVFFAELTRRCSVCHEGQLPNAGQRYCKSAKIAMGPFSAARVTADGEYLFAIDADASSITVYQLFDFTDVEKVKIDFYNGRQYAVIGFSASEAGDKLAVLMHEPKSAKTSVRIIWLNEGVFVRDRVIELKVKRAGTHIPQLAFSPDGETLISFTAALDLCFIDSEAQLQLIAFEPEPNYFEIARTPREELHQVQDGAGLTAWRRYGSHVLRNVASAGLMISNDRQLVVSYRNGWVLLYAGKLYEKAQAKLTCSSGQFAISPDLAQLISVDQDTLLLYNRDKGLQPSNDADAVVRKTQYQFVENPRGNKYREIGRFRELNPRISINANGTLFALATPAVSCIQLYSLPVGRYLGAVFGINEEPIVELRFTPGGTLIAVSQTGMVHVWEADDSGEIVSCGPQYLKFLATRFTSKNVGSQRELQVELLRGWRSKQHRAYMDVANSLLNRPIKIE